MADSLNNKINFAIEALEQAISELVKNVVERTSMQMVENLHGGIQ